MFNVSICCKDSNQVAILEDYLKDFFISKDYDYSTCAYDSYNNFIKSSPKLLDILFMSIDSCDKELVLNIDKKIKSLYNEAFIIYIPDMIDFMLNGYFLKDFNYILSPLKYSAFEDEINQCVNSINNMNSNNNMEYMGDSDLHSQNTKSSVAKIYDLPNIPVYSINYIKYQDFNSYIYTDKGIISTNYSLDELDDKLKNLLFLRCSNDYIINLQKVSKLNKGSVIINNEIIPITKDNFNSLKNKLLVMLKLT